MWYKSPKIVKSWRRFKKLAVLTPAGWLHFGDNRFKDYTQHKDKKRRASYLKRAGSIKDKAGRRTINNPFSANYWAARILWKFKPNK